MARRTERLEVGAIPEARGIATMLDDVVYVQVGLDRPTLRARVGGLAQYHLTQVDPVRRVIPLPHVSIGAGVLERHGMRGTATC